MTQKERDDLVEAFWPRVRRIAGRVGRNFPWPGIDELESEGLLILVQVAGDYDGSQPFNAYATVRIRSRLIDFVRRVGGGQKREGHRSHRHQLFSELANSSSGLFREPAELREMADKSTEPAELGRERREALERSMKFKLSPRQRQVVRLLFFEQVSRPEAAERMGCSIHVVRRLRREAVAILKSDWMKLYGAEARVRCAKLRPRWPVRQREAVAS